ncbi:MAG: azurin [Pseudomonadota bacterium]
MKKLLFTLFITSWTGIAHAACEINVAVADNLQFDQTVLEIDRGCETVKLTLTHRGKLAKNIMGHNWVLANAADLNGIAQDGMKAGLDNNYVKPGDPRVLAYTNVIGGGEQTTTEFTLDTLTQTEYTYFCSFPGHWAVMKGTLKIRG